MMRYERVAWYALTVFLLSGARECITGEEFEALIISVAAKLFVFMCVVYGLSKGRGLYDRRKQVR